MKIILVLVVVTSILFLAGCTSNKDGESAYYAMLRAEAAMPQEKIVEIRAQPGKEITGLESVTVYSQRQRSSSQQYRPQRNEFLALMDKVATIGLPIYLGGKIITDTASIMAGVAQGAFDYNPPVTPVEIVNPVIVDPVIVGP